MFMIVLEFGISILCCSDPTGYSCCCGSHLRYLSLWYCEVSILLSRVALSSSRTITCDKSFGGFALFIHCSSWCLTYIACRTIINSLETSIFIIVLFCWLHHLDKISCQSQKFRFLLFVTAIFLSTLSVYVRPTSLINLVSVSQKIFKFT